ncbi:MULTISPECIES: alanine racemase [unclassified Chelatococcus]|uniref:alanine racemase n=1 Tax=unclassified Chelatococcus TaxID=2638111 RepID=UPI001BD0A1D4|nr:MULTISPECIES: alanine racemase [unclassified Chelatococcus]CAH1658465.1 Alanine racemase [Hyphomicrobiales bacterium]MBS7742167.1 alanine racemase [Chelatococcus sp. HY11]MBX3542715.1 alanine racemase [Chelatococcus sp.]MCO5075069.1 alanine racemase [Chelatococcus sp.]CAH1689840.1 Alanine racemase [Hyphomicrobiales bacterium]
MTPRSSQVVALAHETLTDSAFRSPPKATGLAEACLHVDLAAIRANFAQMQRRFTGGAVTAVVKSNAYGLGLEPVVASLSAAGCDTFWVDDLEEALRVRAMAPSATVYTLLGLAGREPVAFLKADVVPVLVSVAEMRAVAAFAAASGVPMPVAVQIDTGLGRLGLTGEDFLDGTVLGDLWRHLDVRAWVSHLAAFDRPDDASNDDQYNRLLRWLAELPQAPVSLASSSGVYWPPSWHFDIARVGSALYGVQTSRLWQEGLLPCYRLSGHILRVADYAAGSRVGYAGTELTRTSRIATVAIGYANGLPQRFGQRLQARVGDVLVETVGGIAMNLTMVDVTDISTRELAGCSEVVFLDAGLPLEPLAKACNYAPNALLTAIGAGTRKIYRE